MASPATTTLTVIADVAAFCSVVDVSHDSEFFQVRVYDHGTCQTYARPMRRRHDDCLVIEHQVREIAALVSSPALIAWLVDCGFKAVM